MSVFAAFARTAARWPERNFLNVLPETAEHYGIAAGALRYGDVLAQVTALSDRLALAGYVKGQRIMLLLENRPAYFTWWFAANRLGLSVVPVNPDLRHGELAYMISHAEPVVAVCIASRSRELVAAAQDAGIDMPVIGPEDDLPQPRAGAEVALREGDAEAALLYTSGTTGKPKGCILTNTYFEESGRWYSEAGGLCAMTDQGERMITPLPIFHMNAMAYSLMAMVAVGGCLTVLDRFHPRTWWQSVRDSGATCLHYLGVMPSMLMGADPGPQDRDHKVRFGFGAGVDPKLHAPFEERFGFPLVEGWAMTETGAGAVLCNNLEPRLVGQSCLGRLESAMVARIVDDQGKEGDGPGELLIRRAGADPRFGFFSGYFKNAEATDEAWEDGWFHTGDIVRRDSEGFFFFVDRKKNVIRRSGENIAAVEVESLLMRHPAVSGAGVAAVPDELRGDEVFACLVLHPEARVTAAQIMAWALDQMAYYKAPGYIAFVSALPVTATQKVQRATLKAEAIKLLDDPATVDTRHLKKRSVVREGLE